MFRGNHPAKVDEKGRLKLPGCFQAAGGCAARDPVLHHQRRMARAPRSGRLPEWEKREEQLAESSTLDDAVKKYLNLTSYYGQQVEMDNQARVPVAADFARRGQPGRGSDGLRQ